MAINYSNSELLPAPLRVSTYTEDDNKRQFQWVISELDEDIIRIWDSTVNGETDIIEVTETGDLTQLMQFRVTAGTSTGNSVLDTANVTLTNGGTVVSFTDIPTSTPVTFDITSILWQQNSFHIEKNGVTLTKNIDVFLEDTNTLRFTGRLQQDDIISFVYYTGL